MVVPVSFSFFTIFRESPQSQSQYSWRDHDPHHECSYLCSRSTEVHYPKKKKKNVTSADQSRFTSRDHRIRTEGRFCLRFTFVSLERFVLEDLFSSIFTLQSDLSCRKEWCILRTFCSKRPTWLNILSGSLLWCLFGFYIEINNVANSMVGWLKTRENLAHLFLQEMEVERTRAWMSWQRCFRIPFRFIQRRNCTWRDLFRFVLFHNRIRLREETWARWVFLKKTPGNEKKANSVSKLTIVRAC